MSVLYFSWILDLCSRLSILDLLPAAPVIGVLVHPFEPVLCQQLSIRTYFRLETQDVLFELFINKLLHHLLGLLPFAVKIQVVMN